MSQPIEQLKFHTFDGFGARHDLPHDIRTRREVLLVDKFSCPSHIAEDGLTEMATEERVRRTERVVE